MKKILFVVFIGMMGTYSFSHAQKNYVEGIVVLLNGDTLKGLINDQKWEKNPRMISFRSATNEDTMFGSNEVSFFKTVEGSYFKSAITTIDKSPTKLSEIERSKKQSHIVRDSVFLEILVLGKCNLYFLMDENSKRHYFVEKEGKITELVQKFVVTEAGESDVSKKKILGKIDIYKGQLSEILIDCDFAKEKISKLKFDRASMMKIIEEYNTCKDSKSAYVNTDKSVIVESGAVAGLTLN